MLLCFSNTCGAVCYGWRARGSKIELFGFQIRPASAMGLKSIRPSTQATFCFLLGRKRGFPVAGRPRGHREPWGFQGLREPRNGPGGI